MTNAGTDKQLSPADQKELRIFEIQAGVKKVIYGTAIVGVAAAFFPFAQQAATEWFKFSSAETIAQQTAIESTRAFLELVSDEGRSANIDERIVLAEYYKHLSLTEDEQSRWGDYLQILVKQRKEKREAEIASVTAENSPESSDLDVALAATKAEQLQQSANPSGRQRVLTPKSFNRSVGMLESNDASVRRQARSDLASIGVNLTKQALEKLKFPENSYRMRLGLIVALTEMIRENKSSRLEIIEQIEVSDLKNLMSFAISEDRTTRIHASEFLYDLGDERVYELIGDIWAANVSDTGKYNLALILKGAAPFVSVVNKDNAIDIATEYLGTVGPRTDKLLNDALSFLRK